MKNRTINLIHLFSPEKDITKILDGFSQCQHMHFPEKIWLLHYYGLLLADRVSSLKDHLLDYLRSVN